MISTLKHENLKTNSEKRLKIFESITGKQEKVNETRNLKITGINPFIKILELQVMLEEFGLLHVLDTQLIAQGTVIAAYYDLRDAKSAFVYLDSKYSVSYLSDPPFEEYCDILNIYVDKSYMPVINTIFNQSTYKNYTVANMITFRYYDLRTIWAFQYMISSIKNSKALGNPEKIPNYEEKENLRPLTFVSRKASENLTKYVISLKAISQSTDNRTTLMIKNIPNKYTQSMLLDSINRNNSLTFDFLYLPIDFKNKCNVGYAFINFIDFRYITSFYQEFDGKKWEKFNSEKICALSYARIQGRHNLEKHFQSSNIMIQEKNMRPLIFSYYK